MRKILLALLVMLMTIGLLTGCGEKPEEQATESYTVTVDKDSLSMGVYEKQVISVTVTDSKGQTVEKPVTWTSSSPAVAEVTDGVVYAKSAGKATITAKLENGTEASCVVEAAYTGSIPQLILNNTDNGKLSIALGQTFVLENTITYNGQDCTDSDTTFIYAVTDTSVATVSDDGVITGVAEGTTELTVIASWRGLGGENLDGGEDAYGLKQVLQISVVKP